MAESYRWEPIKHDYPTTTVETHSPAEIGCSERILMLRDLTEDIYISVELPADIRLCRRVPLPAPAPQASLDSVLAEVYEWQRQTFTTATNESIIAHLMAEAKELAANPTDAEEMADVLMLLSALAKWQNVDLTQEVRHKLDINRARAWASQIAKDM